MVISVQATASQPTQPKCVSEPSGARPMIIPEVRTASPEPTCCSDALKLMKLPRSRGSTEPVISAIAGPKRPVTKMKKSVENGTTATSGSRGRWVVIRIGTIEIAARMVNIRCLPWRSASQPKTCAVTSVASPPAK